MYSKSFAISINTGTLSSTLLRFRKHGIGYGMDIMSPLLAKEVCDFFMDVPGEELRLKGAVRTLIKGAMKNSVPEEIINRNDKLPFSPDANKRTAQIKDLKYLTHFNHDVHVPGVDFEKLKLIISQIDNSDIKTEWDINKKLYYIPLVIIAVEFLKYLEKKSGIAVVVAAVIICTIG